MTLPSQNNTNLSLSERAFVSDQVRLRLGRFADPKWQARIPQIDKIDLDAVQRASWRPVVIFQKNRTGLTTILKRGNNSRNSEFMEVVEAFGKAQNTTFVIDFGDSIPFRYEPFESLNIPVFAKNRPVGSNAPIILWTHSVYRHFREGGIAGHYGQVPWGSKAPDLVWRGAPRGSLLVNEGFFVSAYDLYCHLAGQTDVRLRQIIDTFGDRDFKDIAEENLSRFIAVSTYADKYDLRFVSTRFEMSEDYFSFLQDKGYRFGSTMEIKQLLEYKYHLILEGNDAGTQINWALSSGSVMLMPPKMFHSATSLGLQEWVHYVPLRSDLLDLEERLDWCRSNDGECRAIAENALAYVAKFRGPVEDEINRQILTRYSSVPLSVRMRRLFRRA